MGLSMTGPALRPIFSRMAQSRVAAMRRAFARAAADVAGEIETAGRNDLRTAGNFGKWAGEAGAVAHGQLDNVYWVLSARA
jgi:hypothetical protein